MSKENEKQDPKERPKEIWTEKVLADLQEVIKHDIPLTEFKKLYPDIPEKELQEKAKFYTGVSNTRGSVEFIAGMGRLSTEDLPANSDQFKFPNFNFRKPYVVVADKKDWSLMILNGSNIGIKHSRLIQDNPSRRALADAEKRGDVAVILANPIEIDTTKAAGALKVHKAQTSGQNTNLEFLPKSYQKEAKSILKNKPVDQLIFESIATRFLNVLSGWHKITHRPDLSPEYNGPVVLVLGFKEEALIVSAAYHECRYLWILKKQKLDVEIRFTKKMLAQARKDGDKSKIKKLSNRLEDLAQQQSMTILSNIRDADYERHRCRMTALIVKKFEEMIPNCKVISQGTTYIKVGEEVIEINIPHHISVTPSLLANYTREHGPKIYRDSLAPNVVICHPYSLNYRMTVREDSKDGQRASSMIHVAPIAVDDVFLRGELKVIRGVHPITRAIFNEQFKPGVLVLNRTNGIVAGDPLPIAKLDKVKLAEGDTNKYYPYPEVKYIWVYEHTDNHFGSRSKEWVRDDKNKRNLGMAEAAIEMIRREGLCNEDDMPIHIVTTNDDETQGNHFETHKQPDPKEIKYIEIENRWRKNQAELERLIKKGDTTEAAALVEEMARFNLGQFAIRGLDWVQPQMFEVYERHIEPNIDFYSSVLGRSIKAKLALRGVSEITKVDYDSRDVGFINFGTGNHFESSVDRTMTEGVFYAKHLQAMLGQLPQWQGKKDLLEKIVRAPLYSNQYFAWGTVKAPGGYEWGLWFASSPARLSSWDDPLLAIVGNDHHRGDTGSFLKNRVTLKTFGDKHFFATVHTPYFAYFMCAAGCRTDLYGERGFPPNNTGVGFVGLPVGGPDSGPILTRTLRYDYIRDWFANPKPFDWKKFLPNSLK